MKRAAVSLALLLAGCATVPDRHRTEADIAEQIAAWRSAKPDDRATLDMLAGGNVVRDGRRLTVRTGARTFRFVDGGYCEGYQTCARYRVDRLFHGRFLGIGMIHGEYPDSYLIIDLARGTRLFDTGVRPVPAPVPPLAAVAEDPGDMGSFVLGGLAVVDLGARRVLWHEPDWYVDATIAAWEGPVCVRASYRPLQETGPEPTRTVWIADSGGQWAAHDSRPAVCWPG